MIGYDAMFAVMIAMIVVMGPLLLLLRPPKVLPAEPVEAAH